MRRVTLFVAVLIIVTTAALAPLPAPAFAQADQDMPCWMYDPIGADCTSGGGGGGSGGYWGSLVGSLECLIFPSLCAGPCAGACQTCKTYYLMDICENADGDGRCSCGADSDFPYTCHLAGDYCTGVTVTP